LGINSNSHFQPQNAWLLSGIFFIYSFSVIFIKQRFKKDQVPDENISKKNNDTMQKQGVPDFSSGGGIP